MLSRVAKPTRDTCGNDRQGEKYNTSVKLMTVSAERIIVVLKE
jgi:hypothetical protein